MCKNGYKTVNCLGPELHFKSTIWSIKKQKYICKASSSCSEVITKLAAVKDIKYRNHISLAIKQLAMMLLTKNESQSDLAKELNVSEKFSVLFVVTNKKSIIVSNMTLIQTVLLKGLTIKLKLLNYGFRNFFNCV